MNRNRLSLLTIATLAGALILFVSACSLVTSQYKARSLVAQTEKMQNEVKRLNDDASELYMEISRAALPGYIASQAQRAGLEPATSRNTVVLDYRPLPAGAGNGGAE
ncbi:MAG: cell division protein FtsL [Sutterellaceae bacterium]|nr:cell division protein FtsL [Sutterellaceae bacterium]MDD7442206.1 cell division protein FtsL [Sutterellaceae bacterium]MDY2868201.1 cell division protein FtsL [Mesosutterella sp.]